MTEGVTQDEIDSIRRSQKFYMPDLGIIRRKTYVGGDDEFVDENVEINVPHRLTPGFGAWTSVADRFQGVTPFTLTVPYSTDLKDGDVFIDAAARAFQVRAVKAPESYLTAKQALLDLVTGV